MKLSDYVMEKIADTGVKHIFMLPGGGAMHLNDSLGRCQRLEYIVNLHEQAAAIAADAYSQYSNNLGVCMVTTGPGGTNAITGVAASFMDSIPLLVISGQVKRADITGNRGIRQMGFQEIDIVSIVKTITKYAVTVTEPDEIGYHLEKAIWIAQNGRQGPCWIDIPLDVQAAEITTKTLKGFQPEINKNEMKRTKALTNEVSRVIEILQNAERPVILAGNGIRAAKALDEFQDLIRHLQIPILTTWKTMDFLAEDDPLYAGRPGAIGQRGANFSQQNADCLITIGARLDFGQTAYNHANFAPSAQKIFVDIDQAELDKMNPQPTLAICADAREFIQEILKQVTELKRPEKWDEWLQKTKMWQQRYPVILPEYKKETNYVNDYLLIDILSQKMTPNDLLIPGSSGACSERTMQAFRVKKWQRIFNSQGLGSMGFGLSAAIGGCIASDQKQTIMIEGDGGFAMNLQELETVKRLNLPIKIFLLNNLGYASIRNTQNNYFAGRCYASCETGGLTLPNWGEIAEGFDLPYHRLTKNTELDPKLDEILKQNGPILCEIMVSPDQQTAPKVTSRKTPDGCMESAPMEDMAPLLDRDEFAENMKNI